MTQLHNTVIQPVIKGLMERWEENNPHPQLTLSDDAINEFLSVLRQTVEYRTTNALFISGNSDLIPEWKTDCYVTIYYNGKVVKSFFKLTFPQLVGYLPKEGDQYLLMCGDHTPYVSMGENSRLVAELKSYETTTKQYMENKIEVRDNLITNLRLLNNVSDLYEAWPEATEFLPDSAKVTGVVLPVSELNETFGLK